MLEDLCKGDLVFVQARTSSVGAMGGDGGSWASDSGAGIECRVDELSASEIAKYSAAGMAVTHTVMFLQNPSLGVKDRLHWTKTNGLKTAISDRYLHVQGQFREGDPFGRLQYWVVATRLETTVGG